MEWEEEERMKENFELFNKAMDNYRKKRATVDGVYVKHPTAVKVYGKKNYKTNKKLLLL